MRFVVYHEKIMEFDLIHIFYLILFNATTIKLLEA